jgi:hypothetical protein
MAARRAGALIFGPFSDLGALQLAAGPRAETPARWPAERARARRRIRAAVAERRAAAAA